MSIIENYNSFLILTDLEPDDMLGLWLLSSKIRSKKILFLVGEGDSLMKEKRMKVYAKQFGFVNSKVLRGYSSNKQFPYDGYDIMTKDERDNIMYEEEKKHTILETIGEYIKENAPFIISMKPPRELIEMYSAGFDFSKLTLAGYMSFNLRCLMKKWKKEQIAFFLKSFKECYYYETYHAIGSNNIITAKDLEWKFIPKVVKKVMALWNKYMIEDCQETIKNLKGKTDERSKAKIHRNEKCLKQILDNDSKQFVNADTGLVLSLLEGNPSYKEKSLKFDEKTGYSVLGEGNDVKVIQPKEKDFYKEYQIGLMTSIGVFMRVKYPNMF